MAQNQILIGKNLNYAASKSSTSEDAATSPELLRDGALGFYLEDGTLIPAAGTGMSTATKFYIAQGTADGCITTPLLDKRSTLKTKYNKDYTAPVKQISYVGYNGTSGDLQTGTIVANDEALIKVINTTGGRQTFPKQTYTAILDAGASDYEVALGLVTDINNTAFQGSTEDFIVADVVSNGTFAELDNDPTVTNGSAIVAVDTDLSYGGGATDLVVGDFLRIRGATYEIIAIDTLDVTLDRPYEGVSETIDVSTTTNLAGRLTSITAYGVRITSVQDGDHFRLAVGGVIEDADITYSTPFNPGSGTAAQVLKLENDFSGASRGRWNQVGPYAKFPTFTTYTDSSATYDLYNITTINQFKDKTGMNSNIGVPVYVVIANHASATGANTALDTITAAI